MLPTTPNVLKSVPARAIQLFTPPNATHFEAFRTLNNSDDYLASIICWDGNMWAIPTAQELTDPNRKILSKTYADCKDYGGLSESNSASGQFVAETKKRPFCPLFMFASYVRESQVLIFEGGPTRTFYTSSSTIRLVSTTSATPRFCLSGLTMV